MAVTSYISAFEATLFYDDALYDSNDRSQALTLSFGLFQGYLNSSLRVPVVPEWDGGPSSAITAPAVLKIGQGMFYEYLLRRGQVGNTPDVVEIFEAAKEYASSITQDQLTVPEAGVFPREAGWHIVAKSVAGGGGDVFIRGGTSPKYTEPLKLVITNAVSADYPGTFTYSLFAYGRQAAAISTGNATSIDWTAVTGPDGDQPFEIRWIGKWVNNDYVELFGVPQERVDALEPQRDTIQQGRVAY